MDRGKEIMICIRTKGSSSGQINFSERFSEIYIASGNSDINRQKLLTFVVSSGHP